MKEFLKSVKISQSYCQSFGAWFFGTRCIIKHVVHCTYLLTYLHSYIDHESATYIITRCHLHIIIVVYSANAPVAVSGALSGALLAGYVIQIQS